MKKVLLVALLLGTPAMAQVSPFNPAVTYVALRDVAGAFGQFMTLDLNILKLPRLTTAGVAYTFIPGDDKAYPEGKDPITLPGTVVIQDGITYVPAPFFDALGCVISPAVGNAQAVNIACKNKEGDLEGNDFEQP